MTRRSKLHAATHLEAFSTLLAQDGDAKQLHMRDLQIIALLVEQGEPLSVSTMATMLSVSIPHISRLGERLVARGFAQCAWNETDRRRLMYSPTAEGRALDERVRGHFEVSARIATEAVTRANERKRA